MMVKIRNVDIINLNGEEIDEVEDITYVGHNISRDGESDWDILAGIGKARAAFSAEACMEIKVDIQKDQFKDIQHQCEVCLPVWFRDMEKNQRNLQKPTLLRHRMPEVHHGYLLARGPKERRTVGKG